MTEPDWFDDPGMCFDRQGQPMRMSDWGRRHDDDDYRTVAQHWVRGWMVSTVWLGLDHGFGMSHAPLIFETMIFAPADATIGGEDQEAGPVVPGLTVADLDQYQERYATEEAAQAGHDRAIAALAALLGADAMADIAGPLIAGSSDSEWDGDLGDGTWPALTCSRAALRSCIVPGRITPSRCAGSWLTSWGCRRHGRPDLGKV